MRKKEGIMVKMGKNPQIHRKCESPGPEGEVVDSSNSPSIGESPVTSTTA
jgi:hypothetical protein